MIHLGQLMVTQDSFYFDLKSNNPVSTKVTLMGAKL